MPSLIKKCSQCGWVPETDDVEYCALCGSKLSVRGESFATRSGLSGNKIQGNAGDVSVTDHSQTTIHITEKEKSHAEKIQDAEHEFRRYCRSLCEDKRGRLNESDRIEIDKRRNDLLLDFSRAQSILEEEIHYATPRQVDLPDSIRVKLLDIDSVISDNKQDILRSRLVELRASKKEYNSDELNQSYYRLYAILESNNFILEYERKTACCYWEIWWSAVAYALNGRYNKAAEAVALLGKYRDMYPDQNIALLETAIKVIEVQEDSAKRLFSTVGCGCSDCLMLLRDTIQYLLYYIDGEAPTKYLFYIHSLFTSYGATIHQREAQAKAEQEQRELQEEKELRRRLREERVAKWRPWIIGLVVVALLICTSIIIVSHVHMHQYENQRNTFDATYKLIDSSPSGLESLSKCCTIVKDMRQLENFEYFVNTKESSDLIDKLQQKSNELLKIAQKKYTLPVDSGGDTIIWENGQKDIETIKELQKSLLP